MKIYTALFKGVRYSEGAEHPAVPHIPVSHSIEKRYIQKLAVLQRFRSHEYIQGFTLLEISIIILAIGILAAIMAPGWNALLARLRLNQAQDQVYQAIRDAQATARRLHVAHQASFRTLNGKVQWTIHPISVNAVSVVWNDLDPDIELDSETTLQLAGGVRRVQFNENGNVRGQLGRITLATKAGGRTRRCVIVSTLIGAVRKGEDRSRPDSSGRFCY